VVEDLHSTNGTQVNGSDVLDPRLLQVGDRVEVGDTVFQVEVR
jgi:pSer/pThr/pTyr-binding forkhead associated (FHA) protein